jgi:hypothetical protein
MDNAVATLIAVGGTLAGTFITSYFNYISKKLNHKLFVGQIRVTRKFNAYEELLQTIQKALAVLIVKDKEPPYNLELEILSSADAFQGWFATFSNQWSMKEHLLDADSKYNCRMLHIRLIEAKEHYPHLRGEMKNFEGTMEDFFQLNQVVRLLASKCKESLELYLSKQIEVL